MYQSVYLSWKIAVPNDGRVFTYFCSGHKIIVSHNFVSLLNNLPWDKNWFMLTIKKCLRFNIILKLETIQGRIHRDKIKKAVLTTTTYFKVSTPVRSQRQLFTFYLNVFNSFKTFSVFLNLKKLPRLLNVFSMLSNISEYIYWWWQIFLRCSWYMVARILQIYLIVHGKLEVILRISETVDNPYILIKLHCCSSYKIWKPNKK